MKVLSIIRHGALFAALTALAIGTVARTSYAQQDPGLILRPSEQGTQDAFSAQAEEQLPEPSIHAETTVVNLDVLVTDHDALFYLAFEPTSAPITIAMLLEYSGSNYNYFAYKAASWGSNVLNRLDPLDWVALVTYDIKPAVRVDFTRNKAEMQQTLSTSEGNGLNRWRRILHTVAIETARQSKDRCPDRVPRLHRFFFGPARLRSGQLSFRPRCSTSSPHAV